MDVSLIHGVWHRLDPRRSSHLGGLIFAREPAEGNGSSIHHDLRAPFLILLVPVNATIPRRGPRLTGNILGAFGSRDDSQVRPSIVEFVAIDVVNESTIALRHRHHFAVHTHVAGLALATTPASVTIDTPKPPMPADPFGIGSINDCITRDAAVLGMQRHGRRYPIGVQHDCRSRTAIPGAIDRLPTHPAWGTAERLSAHGTGTLNRHSETTFRDVTPPADLTIGAGAHRVNCTRLHTLTRSNRQTTGGAA